MSIRDWIHQREIEGLATFTYNDVAGAFPDFAPQTLLNNLYRARKAGIVTQPFRGFYVIVPPHYAAKGVIPPVYYIDQLMAYLKKPYYILMEVGNGSRISTLFDQP